jgi:hypothetical protein
MKVLTPQLYARLVAMACKTKAPEVDVIDLWAVPDYQKYFMPFIHSDLGRYAKGMCCGVYLLELLFPYNFIIVIIYIYLILLTVRKMVTTSDHF